MRKQIAIAASLVLTTLMTGVAHAQDSIGLTLAAGVIANATPSPQEDFSEPVYLFSVQRVMKKHFVLEGDVNYWRTGQPEVPATQPQPLDFGDGLRTLQIGRATVRLLDLQFLRLKDHTRLEIRKSVPPAVLPTLKMHEGQLYVSERGRSPRVIPIEGPHSQITPRGTEFLVAVDLQAQKTEVTMFDGEAQVQGLSLIHI